MLLSNFLLLRLLLLSPSPSSSPRGRVWKGREILSYEMVKRGENGDGLDIHPRGRDICKNTVVYKLSYPNFNELHFQFIDKLNKRLIINKI